MTIIPSEAMISKLMSEEDHQVGPADLIDFPLKAGFVPDSESTKETAICCEYLNAISVFIRQKVNSQYLVQFFDTEKKVPIGHPTGTKCRPDISALKVPENQSNVDLEKFHWSHLQATGETLSSGKTEAEGLRQGAAYGGYHLQARPDLISVPGIFVKGDRFEIYNHNACQSYHTGQVEWDSFEARRLLYAWMKRIYRPHHDTTIRIDDRLETTLPTFTIDGKYQNYSILRVGAPIGRRTIVLSNPESNTVIKEQYVENGRRFEEGPIVTTIHQDGQFPGIVRIKEFESVKSGENEIVIEHGSIKRTKRRLVMEDKADLLMAVKTPRDVLMALYDVLEVTRVLWRKHKILHRDISPNNILVREKAQHLEESMRDDLGDMCFSEFLLKHQTTSTPITPSEMKRNPLRYATKVVLIDFDMAEDQTPMPTKTGDPKIRTGTPLWMARLLRANGYSKAEVISRPIPQLGDSDQVYRRFLFERLETFPSNELEVLFVKPGKLPSSFRHKLRYDAESVFWSMVWWCIQARPNGDNKGSKIKLNHWMRLTSAEDDRNSLINDFPTKSLHPEYQELETLLYNMAALLRGDYDFSQDNLRRQDEYLHEAFQRLIYQFLVDNHDQKFMNQEKDPLPREVERSIVMSNYPCSPSTQPSSSNVGSSHHSNKRKNGSESGEGGSSGSARKKPRTETGGSHRPHISSSLSSHVISPT